MGQAQLSACPSNKESDMKNHNQYDRVKRMAKAKRRSKELRELRRFKLAHKYETLHDVQCDEHRSHAEKIGER